MKRRIAGLLIAAALLLCAWPCLAADYTLEEKFVLQIQQSAYRAAVTLHAEGESTAALPQEVWRAIKALSDRAALTVEESVQRGHTEAVLTLKIDGEAAGRTVLRMNADLIGAASDLLAGDGRFYAAPRDWDGAAVLSGAGVSPGLTQGVRLLLAVNGASSEWRQKAADAFRGLETDLEIWVNSYADFSLGSEDGTDYTELSFLLPRDGVKAEMLRLLDDLYGSDRLLSVLREIAPAGTEAWLQPGAGNTLREAVSGMELGGDIALLRRYDSLGRPLLDEITLPLNGTEEEVTIALRPTAAGQEWAFTLKRADGETRLNFAQTAEDRYEGAFVRKAADGGELSALDFILTWQTGEEQYSLSADQFEKTVAGELLLIPREGQPRQSVTLNALLSSGSSKQSATRLNGTLAWRDEETGAAVTVTLESKTAAPFAIETLEDAEEVIRLDQMTAEDLAGLLPRFGESAGEWLENLGTGLGL